MQGVKQKKLIHRVHAVGVSLFIFTFAVYSNYINMAEKENGKKKKETLLSRLKTRYRLILYRHSSFEEIWYKNITKLGVISYGLFFIVLYTLFITALIMFTPINRLLPAYRDSELQQRIINNAIRADSLEYEIRMRDQYIDNIKRIISGKAPKNYQSNPDSVRNYNNINFAESNQDSALRQELEQDVQLSEEANQFSMGQSLGNLDLFSPVNGMVINAFNSQEAHYGVDIVSEKDEPVLSVLDGTVISADWTLQTGYVIRVQHKNDLISCYKHNSVLFKEVGDQVNSGETIAIIGNTGEFSTGPHLHFELWYQGEAVNPENYVTF